MNNKSEQVNSWNDVEIAQKELVYSILLDASNRMAEEMVEANTFSLFERVNAIMKDHTALTFALAALGHRFQINHEPMSVEH